MSTLDPHQPEVLREHAEGARRLARHLIRDPDMAEDVAQESLLLAIGQAPGSVRNLGAWLRGVVRNKARHIRRTEERRRAYTLQAVSPPPAPATADVAARVELHEHLLSAVKAMPPKYRQALWLRFFDGFSVREIAAALDVPLETVRTRLKRALHQLRGDLDRRHGGSRAAWLAALGGPARQASGCAGSTGVTVLMTAKLKSLFVGALLLLLAGTTIWWFGLRGGGGASEPENTASPSVVANVAVADHAEAPGLQARPVAKAAEPAQASILLHVVDATGKPLEGADLYPAAPRAHYVARSGRWRGRTDAEGIAAVPTAVLGEGEVLLVRRAGFLPQTVAALAAPPAEGAEREIVLQRGLRVAGHVFDPWGKPLAGVDVYVRPNFAAAPHEVGDLLPGPSTAAMYGSTTSDAEGHFVFSGIPALPVQLTARRSAWICPLRPDHFVREEREDLRLVLYPQGRVGIRAFDAVTKLPIAAFRAEGSSGEASQRGYGRSELYGPLGDLPPTGLSKQGGEHWLTFNLLSGTGPRQARTVPVLVEAWGYRRTTVELPLRYAGDGAFTAPQDVFLEPLRSRDALGKVVFRVAFPALERAPDQVWISLDSDVLDLPADTEPEIPAGIAFKRDSRHRARSSLRLWLQDGQVAVELPVGRHEAALEGGSASPAPPDWTPFEVREGETTTVELTIQGSVVCVRAYGPERDVIPYFRVSTHWRGGRSSGSSYRSHAMLFDGESLRSEAHTYGVESGQITTGVPPVPLVTIVVLAPGFEIWSGKLDIEAGKRHEIEAVLRPLPKAPR